MSLLRQLLDDVLAGVRVIDDRFTFDLLRQIAPEKAEQLNRLEGEAIARRAVPFITAVERIKRELDQPQPTTPAPAPTGVPSPVKLTRVELEEIVNKRGPATMAEIEWLLAHARDPALQISSGEEHELRARAARIQADSRMASSSRPPPNDEFAVKVLGTHRTAYGDLSSSEVNCLETIKAKAQRSMAACQKHELERCRCWAPARHELFDIRRNAGEKSAFGASAVALWNTLESAARDRHPEPVSESEPGVLPGIFYNWRAYKCPDYMNQILRRP